MDTEAVKMFSVLATKLSYTETAKIFDISQPTLSRRIQALEDSLGVRLFHRLGRSVRLTPQGEAFLRSAEEINALIAHSLEQLHIAKKGVSGQLKIGCLHPMARFMVRHFLPNFHAKYPDIAIYLHTLAPSDLGSFEDVDLMITPFDMQIENVVSRPIDHYRRNCYAAPSYLAKKGTPQFVRDLELHHCITQTNALTNERTWKLHHTKQPSVQVNVQGPLMTNSMDIAIDMTKAGFGIGLLPDDQVFQEVANGELVLLFNGEWYVDGMIHVIYKPNALTPERYRIFIEEFERFNRSW
ncbi:LysR family transcriptional regulator [Vibrio sp. SM6]|uniref:LysR family transcriptional regulator n=1 Tax=Vibrio agarilyticus TaxID=2726741 RepID=A0A7X8TPR1_9VIBR|nr:LysR family transcriptional regulator [Vibrio agarilyticus]NLS12495.1 LysR family transcriptional regulator [Vibrio agarilyticus]